MANFASPVSTYSDTTPQKRVISDVISIIDPSDAPLVEGLGGLDGGSSKFRFVNTPGTVVEWLEDTLPPLTSSLAHSATVASTATSITLADGNMVQPGHILLIGSEQVWVSAMSSASATVTRGAFGTTAASATSTASFSIIGIARLEGADSDSIGYTDRTTNSNNSQIYHQEIKVTETQQVIQQYGIPSEFDYQANKAIPGLMRLIEKQMVYGAKTAGSTTTARAMGGYSAFVTTNLVSGASLTQAAFENAVMSAYNAGGVGPWVAMVNPVMYQKIKNFYDSSLFVRVTPDQNTVGMVVDAVRTPFGDVHLTLNRWWPTTLIPIIDPTLAGFVTIRPFTQEPLAKVGDSQKGEVVGEFTFALKQEKAHALLTACS